MTLVTDKPRSQAEKSGIYKRKLSFRYPLPPPRMDAKQLQEAQRESLPLELCPFAFLTQQNFYQF